MAPLTHAKWAALFKKHIGVLESHVKLMERTEAGLKSVREKEISAGLGEGQGSERQMELVEGMVGRAHEILGQARTVLGVEGKGKGKVKKTGEADIILIREKQPKKKLKERERKKEQGEGVLGVDGIGEQSQGGKDEGLEEYKPISLVGTKRPREEEGGEESGNEYFVIDTNPTPVTDKKAEKKEKKRKKEKTAEDILAEPELISRKTTAPATAVDEATEQGELKEKEKKKRKRQSDGVESAKKEKKKSKTAGEEKEKEKEKDKSKKRKERGEKDGNEQKKRRGNSEDDD